MQLDTDKLLENAIYDGVREAVKSKLAGYNSPLEKLLEQAIAKHAPSIQALLCESLQSCIGDESFKQEIRDATRKILAKTLVARFGGELEKQVNTLKSDPATRARIVVAIEDIVGSKPS